MKLKIEIEMDNAAFDDGYNGDETARILRELASKCRGINLNAGDDMNLRDSNGNHAGVAKVVE